MSLSSPSIASSDATLVPQASSIVNGGQQQNGTGNGTSNGPDTLNVQIYVPEYNVQKCLHTHLDETIWEIKQKIITTLPKDMQEGFNYGLFLPPCNGRAGKFLLEERPLRDYPFQDCVPYLELKYKKRVYKMLNLDEKALKQLHTKAVLKKFLEHVEAKQVDKVEKLCAQGLDPNFHDSTGETPFTIAASTDENRDMLLTLTSGGAHLDFRNMEGQTALHKAAFLTSHANVKTMLELGASPNYKDPLGLTPLYYCMLKPNTNPNTAELLLHNYAELGVTDPHGNQEVHQACKNGLVPHLEHLLFYGVAINCQNVNGNTPLHVCAVNDQEACARVLLFRGADPNIVNNQGQTAFHVAVITGHHAVAEVIRTHDPATAVPYRGAPRYNSKRRLNWRSNVGSVGRAKSFLGSPAASECGYGTIRGALGRAQPGRAASEMNCFSNSPMSSVAPSPNVLRHPTFVNQQQQQQHYAGPMRRSLPAQQPHHRPLHQTQSVATAGFVGTHAAVNEYRAGIVHMVKKTVSEQNAMVGPVHAGTVRGSIDNGVPAATQRIPPDVLQFTTPPVIMNVDVNIPRILVIPRGPKGFGFILRGAKKVDPTVNFEPTPEIPALQYFEGVDMNGMAMKAGLKPGDFLLEINGTDVRCASHDQVVNLIQMSGETITLKVITIDPSEPMPAVAFYGTLRRNSKQAPPPPVRHSATSLSIASGRNAALGLVRYDDYGGSVHHVYPNATISGAKSTEHLPVAYRDPRDKVASVRRRVNSRRISAAELEQLMARQNATNSHDSSFSSEAETPGTPNSTRNSCILNGPKVYNSVAEMKRQKLQRNQPKTSIILIDSNVAPPVNMSPNGAGLKSFHSSPDLQQATALSLARDYAAQDDFEDDYRVGSISSHQQQQRPCADTRRFSDKRSVNGNTVQRPKTPPPAPPPPQPGKPAPIPPHGVGVQGLGSHGAGPSTYACVRTVPDNPHGGRGGCEENGRRYKDQQHQQQQMSNGYYSTYSNPPVIPEPDYDDPHVEVASAMGGGPPAPPPPPPPPPLPSGGNDLKSALAMKRQQILSKTASNSSNESSSHAAHIIGDTPAETPAKKNGKVDFNLDLKNAIAKRRTQLDKRKDGPDNDNPQANGGRHGAENEDGDSKIAARVVGMSLKESVQNNIQPARKSNGTTTASGKTTNGTVAANGSTARGNNSPPISNGFANKKDSGFSSSRNSLEPSECEETASSNGSAAGDANEMGNADALRQHRVSVLSHQLEDSIGTAQITLRGGTSKINVSRNQHQTVTKQNSSPDQHDAISLTSTLSTLSGCSDATGSSKTSADRFQQQRAIRQLDSSSIPPMPKMPPPVPPPDYDAADSGTGDSETEDVTPNLSQQNLAHKSMGFGDKPLATWSVGDVCDWLDSLYLSEYKRGFARGNVDGRRLANCDRTQFTQLGVTRIAHRIAMENSIKQYKPQ